MYFFTPILVMLYILLLYIIMECIIKLKKDREPDRAESFDAVKYKLKSHAIRTLLAMLFVGYTPATQPPRADKSRVLCLSVDPKSPPYSQPALDRERVCRC